MTHFLIRNMTRVGQFLRNTTKVGQNDLTPPIADASDHPCIHYKTTPKYLELTLLQYKFWLIHLSFYSHMKCSIRINYPLQPSECLDRDWSWYWLSNIDRNVFSKNRLVRWVGSLCSQKRIGWTHIYVFQSCIMQFLSLKLFF